MYTQEPLPGCTPPSHDVYKAFYAAHAKTPTEQARLIGGRALVFDNHHLGKRLHLILRSAGYDAPYRHSRPVDQRSGQTFDNFEYDRDQFSVVVTDGTAIQQLHTRRVHGIYPRLDGTVPGRYNGVDNPFSIAKMRLLIDLCSEKDGPPMRLDISRNGDSGRFWIGEAGGWILPADVSDTLRTAAVTPPAEGQLITLPTAVPAYRQAA